MEGCIGAAQPALAAACPSPPPSRPALLLAALWAGAECGSGTARDDGAARAREKRDQACSDSRLSAQGRRTRRQPVVHGSTWMGARGAKVMALRAARAAVRSAWTGIAASSRSATARRHATMPLTMTGANGGLPKADAPSPATVRSPWRLASAFLALPFGPAPRRGRPQIGRPRGRPYDGRPGGLRTGSPPSPPPRSIRPTVRRLPRSPRLSGPGPHRGRPPPAAADRPASRRSPPIAAYSAASDTSAVASQMPASSRCISG